jgi:hypothetical protein
MKINLLTPALVAVLGFALASVPVTVHAQTNSTVAPEASAPDAAAPSTAPKVKEKKKSDKMAYEGTLSAIDATSATVTTKKGELKLMIDEKTEFKVDKKKATAADFAAGDKVTGSYMTGADGTMMAHSIHKKAAK